MTSCNLQGFENIMCIFDVYASMTKKKKSEDEEISSIKMHFAFFFKSRNIFFNIKVAVLKGSFGQSPLEVISESFCSSCSSKKKKHL